MLILLLCFIRPLGLGGFAWFVVVSLTGGAILAPSLLPPPLYIGFAYHVPSAPQLPLSPISPSLLHSFLCFASYAP